MDEMEEVVTCNMQSPDQRTRCTEAATLSAEYINVRSSQSANVCLSWYQQQQEVCSFSSSSSNSNSRE